MKDKIHMMICPKGLQEHFTLSKESQFVRSVERCSTGWQQVALKSNFL